MDHQHALNRLRTHQLLSAALDYAIFDRTHSDHFYDPFEIQYAKDNRAELIAEIIQELGTPESFSPRPAIAYFPPKNDLCDRRMVYIQIKDLTIRYAIAILFSEEIEHEIHPQCFANRRSEGDEESERFTEDFATGGWFRFCNWQSEQSQEHTVLLRTDISAFYDSISHSYLVDAVCRHLALPQNCPLIQLFQKILRIPVIYYSPASGQIEQPAVIHQGLPIGDGVEGYLANLFLKDVDDAMTTANASYGRYVDDIRLFGDSREEVIAHLRILQEQLLRKGLNLNSSKTEIAEDVPALEDLISDVYSFEDYSDGESENAGMTISANIDRTFDDFSRTFTEDQEFENPSDAKDFCKFLGAHDDEGNPVVEISERMPWHVSRLRESIVKWRGAGKHAAWLLVQTAVYRGIPATTKRRAQNVMFQILENHDVSSYIRYRILHHLVKMRRNGQGSTFMFLAQLSAARKEQLRNLMPAYVGAPAFELNILGLYTLLILGASMRDLRATVNAHGNSRCQPLRNALALLTRIPATSPSSNAEENEPDETPEPY